MWENCACVAPQLVAASLGQRGFCTFMSNNTRALRRAATARTHCCRIVQILSLQHHHPYTLSPTPPSTGPPSTDPPCPPPRAPAPRATRLSQHPHGPGSRERGASSGLFIRCRRGSDAAGAAAAQERGPGGSVRVGGGVAQSVPAGVLPVPVPAGHGGVRGGRAWGAGSLEKRRGEAMIDRFV